jgi:eukaryotic-like serine/threonine-protein kinase
MLKPYKRAEIAFDLQKEIGHEGRNSRVHVAHDANLDATIVIKTVAKSTLDVDAYFAESQLLYRSSHPNVVPIHYACEDVDSIYLAMPYFHRGSINKQIASRFLTVREVIRYATHFLSGLHNVHSKQLVHLDVKPDNILVTERDEAMLSDFGLAKRTNYAGFAEQDRMYVRILPPEYFRKSPFDTRSDIYQVGLTLYRMLNGNKAFYNQFCAYGKDKNFDRDHFRHDVLNEQFPARDTYLEHVPQRFTKVIARCLKADPAERYRAATEVVTALADIGGPDLDWQYSVESDGARVWSRSEADRSIRLRVDSAGCASAEKRCGDAAARRIKDYCKERITSSEIRRFLKSEGE